MGRLSMDDVEQDRRLRIVRIIANLLLRLKCFCKMKCCESECVNNPQEHVETEKKEYTDKYIQTNDF